jgi:hypothetical protein
MTEQEAKQALRKEQLKAQHLKKLEEAAKVPGLLKKRDALCAEIQKDIESFAAKMKKLLDQDVQLFNKLLDPDCNYMDSPLAGPWTVHWMKQYMIKCDMDFIGFPLDGKPAIAPFVEKTLEASKWAMKWTKAKEQEKTGIEAIL